MKKRSANWSQMKNYSKQEKVKAFQTVYPESFDRTTRFFIYMQIISTVC